jgi:hypothetical protein
MLSSDKIKQLDELGFVWEMNNFNWEQGFEKLVVYAREHGNCVVIAGFKTPSGYELGNWVKWQRAKKSHLSPDKIQRLDELGFVWDPKEQSWEQGFEELVAYKDQHDNCEVNSRFISLSGYKLGSWVSVIRKSKARLSSDRFKRLDELGFVWDPKEQSWEQGFQYLVVYKNQHGSCEAIIRHKTPQGYALGRWIAKQRAEKKHLSSYKIKRLDELGFIWKDGAS